MFRSGVFLLIVFLLVGCQAALPPIPNPPPTLSANPQQPAPTVPSYPSQFNLSHLPEVEQLDTQHSYQLEELIHLAQANNPITRIAWLEAEQAAIAAGMVKATYLPMISASVIGGYQRSKRHTDLDLPLIDIDTRTHSSVHGVVPALSLKWLLFDFGKRNALHGAASDISFASQVKFNAAHQAIIFNVARTFYEYSAARQKTELARQHLQNTTKLVDAAQSRFQAGIGTAIDVAQAKQLQAQANFRLVQNQGAERNAYHALIAAAGLPPTTQIHIADASDRQLPRYEDLPDDATLQAALSYRPDLIATDAARRAAEKSIDSVKADFLPKVALMGVVSAGSTHFNINGLAETSPQSASTAVLLGVSIPLFDGGLRRMRLREAEARAAAAKELVRKNQNDALREIHFAANSLRSALEAYTAATELVDAVRLTYDAALESYEVGLGSMMLATEAANALIDATQAQTVAYSAALIASANLAFMMGQIDIAALPPLHQR